MAKENMVDDALGRALELRNEKIDLLKRIADNRQLLRLLDSNEALSAEQSEWLAEFYPVVRRVRDEQVFAE